MRILILRCICHFPFVFTLRRICRCLQVIILPIPENVKRHTTGKQRPIFNCSLQLRLTVDSGTPRHPAWSSTVNCQLELLGTIENTVFAGRWCGGCPTMVPQVHVEPLCSWVFNLGGTSTSIPLWLVPKTESSEVGLKSKKFCQIRSCNYRPGSSCRCIYSAH